MVTESPEMGSGTVLKVDAAQSPNKSWLIPANSLYKEEIEFGALPSQKTVVLPGINI